MLVGIGYTKVVSVERSIVELLSLQVLCDMVIILVSFILWNVKLNQLKLPCDVMNGPHA
jgi:hypothetical protein